MKSIKRRCSVVNCGRGVVSRGWCHKHWTRWRSHGDPSIVLKASGQEMARRARRHGEAAHLSPHTAEYKAWQSMKSRCYYKKGPAYADYGGRGITVCDRWRNSYEAFLADVGRRPSPSHSLNRIDNDGNYEPGNVEWATIAQQARNTRRNRFLSINGERLCVLDWAARVGVMPELIYRRLARGESPEDAVFRKVKATAGQKSLSREDVIEIRRLLKTGSTGRDIERQYGISSGHVSRIKRNLAWKAIEQAESEAAA